MDEPTRIRALAVGRIVAGTALLLFPTLAAKPWVGGVAGASGARVLVRSLGIRDLVLGLGVIVAGQRGESLKGWLQAGVAADAIDCVGVGLGAHDAPLLGRLAVVGVAAGAGVEGVRLVGGLDH